MEFDYVVVGGGFAGVVLAERIAAKLDRNVLLIEKRSHIGGNAYDYYNEDGIMTQKYGPHIFHTNSKMTYDYLSQFTEWNNYIHRVLAYVNGKEVSLPVNLETVEKLYNRKFTKEGLKELFENCRIKKDRIENSRDVIVTQIGEELYGLLFRNYTKKQWGLYPDELDPQVTKRIPVRFNRDTRYFTDKFQGLPKHGFTKLFERMLDHPNIHLLLNTDYKTVIKSLRFNNLIFTGPIDYYFDYKHGRLTYRSLKFKFETIPAERFQSVGVINYPNDHKYTRITEFKHLYQQRHYKTTICYEYPDSEGEPYYPIPKPEEREIYRLYEKEANTLDNVYFVGRLAEYRYLNMDQVVEASLRLFYAKINTYS